MIDSNFQTEPLRLKDVIDQLVTEHGGFRVTRVLLGNFLARLRRPNAASLNNHLRKDIGLAPKDPPPGFRDLMM